MSRTINGLFYRTAVILGAVLLVFALVATGFAGTAEAQVPDVEDEVPDVEDDNDTGDLLDGLDLGDLTLDELLDLGLLDDLSLDEILELCLLGILLCPDQVDEVDPDPPVEADPVVAEDPKPAEIERPTKIHTGAGGTATDGGGLLPLLLAAGVLTAGGTAAALRWRGAVNR